MFERCIMLSLQIIFYCTFILEFFSSWGQTYTELYVHTYVGNLLAKKEENNTH